MGPELWELFEDGKADDEVAAILQLSQHLRLPPNVRIVSRFGDIATVRLTRGDLLNVSASEDVLDINAGGSLLGPDLEVESAEGDAGSLALSPADLRRPREETATGRGVVVGVVDWGFDFAHPDFRNADGTSRILALWDQRGGKQAASPAPFGYGVVHDRDAINRALSQSDPYAALKYHPADADTGIGCHGTHVASIAAGTGSDDRPVGIAPDAQLVLVHNSPWDESQAGRLGDSVTLLEAIDFIAKTAGERPWVINLSMGCHADQHDGTTLVEQGLDAVVSAAPGRAVCMSVGNYYNKHIHASGRLRPTEKREFEWTVNKRASDYNQLQIWYSWQDQFEITLRTADGRITATARLGERAKIMAGSVEIGNVYHRSHETNSLNNHASIFLYKEAPAGDWSVSVTGIDVIDGRFHAWIEREVACPPCQSRFTPDDADAHSTTGTICNGRRTIAVGAYDNHDKERKIGPFSSVGPTVDGRLKPDLCAPGVRVLAARSMPRPNPGTPPKLTRMSGTSMAAPHATGTVALMFQAASRPLRIEEIHNLLLGSAERVTIPEDDPDRIGIGFLDVDAAVKAARMARTSNAPFRQHTVQTPAINTEVASVAPVAGRDSAAETSETILELDPAAAPVPSHSPLAQCGNLSLWINAFIPRSVPAYTFVVPAGPYAGYSAIPCPMVALPANGHCLSRGYLTDQRTFDPTLGAAQRMRSIAEFSLAPAKWLRHPGAEHLTSGTTEIDKSTGAVTCVKAADMTRCAFQNFRIDPDPAAPTSGNFFMRLDVVGRAADPCVNLAADIDYTGTITVQCVAASGVVEVSFDGLVDSFPAFEMYASLAGVTKPLFRLPPPPGNTVVSLLGGASTHVSGRALFDPFRTRGEGEAVSAPSPLVQRSDALAWEAVRTRAAGVPNRFAEAVLGQELVAADVFDSLHYPGQASLQSRVAERFDIVARAGESLSGGVREGDVLLRRGDGNLAHTAVISASELVPHQATRARGWSPEGGRPGLYAQVVEGGSRPHVYADAFARQLTDDAGRVLPNQIIMRPHADADAAERIDPLSLVVGLGIASTLGRPPPVPLPAPAATPEDDPTLAEDDDTAIICPADVSAFGLKRRDRDLKAGRHPRVQQSQGKVLCKGEAQLSVSQPNDVNLDLLLWNFDIEASFTKVQHEAAIDRLIFELHQRLNAANRTTTGYRVLLSGFASRTGAVEYNQRLATDREDTVAAYLTANLDKFRQGSEPKLGPMITFDRNPGGFAPSARDHVESPEARSARVVAIPVGAPVPPPRPLPTPSMESRLRSLLTASMLLAGDPSAKFLSGALPAARLAGSLWSFDLAMATTLTASNVDCLAPHGAVTHQARVFDVVTWDAVTLDPPATLGHAPMRLPLTASFLLGTFSTTRGAIARNTHPSWRLEAEADVAVAAVFAYELANGADPKPVTDPGLFDAVSSASPTRWWALVCCELVLNKGRADFEPSGHLIASRVYPIMEIRTNFEMRQTIGNITLRRPASSSLPHPWAGGGRHLPAFFADRNEGNKSGFPPLWDLLFDYYEKNAALASTTYTVVDPAKSAPRSLAGNRQALQRRQGTRDPTTVTKVPRQGAFDNIHLAPQMLATFVKIFGLPSTPVTMAPICAHDCFHMHWRWSKAFDAQFTNGWGSSGPYTEAGAPLVHPNQTVRVTTMAGAAGIGYEAIGAGQRADEWMLVMPHGGAYALRVDLSVAQIAEMIKEFLGPLPVVGPLAFGIGTALAALNEDELFGLLYFLLQFWPTMLISKAPPGAAVDVLAFMRRSDLENL